VWKTWNLTNLTQQWVNGAAINYGVILWATNEDSTNGYILHFYASEHSSNQPQLEVIYSLYRAAGGFRQHHRLSGNLLWHRHPLHLWQCQHIKEEIVLSQFGRDNLPDPAQYGLSRANTYLVVAMEFLLTPASIKVFARRQGRKTPIKHGNDFGFYGDDPIEFEDADSTLPLLFPERLCLCRRR
jgi:hypothetical protein